MVSNALCNLYAPIEYDVPSMDIVIIFLSSIILKMSTVKFILEIPQVLKKLINNFYRKILVYSVLHLQLSSIFITIQHNKIECVYIIKTHSK